MRQERPLLDHLSLSSLKLIAAIEREELSRAAATLHIVPSAASRRIAQMEEAMGSTLLHRTTRGVELTPAGLSVARYARSMMNDVESLDAELRNLRAGVTGNIRLVASISAIVQHLPQDLSQFLRSHPAIKVELAEHTSADIVELLLQERADIGVFVAGAEIAGLNLRPYRSERLVVILPLGHRLADRKSLTFDQLLDEEWVELPPGTALAERVAQEALKRGASCAAASRSRAWIRRAAWSSAASASGSCRRPASNSRRTLPAWCACRSTSPGRTAHQLPGRLRAGHAERGEPGAVACTERARGAVGRCTRCVVSHAACASRRRFPGARLPAQQRDQCVDLRRNTVTAPGDVLVGAGQHQPLPVGARQSFDSTPSSTESGTPHARAAPPTARPRCGGRSAAR